MSGVDVADSCRLKDTGKVLKIQMKFCHDDRGLMYANQSMGWKICLLLVEGEKGKKKSVSGRNLSGSVRQDIKKSQSLRRHTRAQIACGICYKRFDLKGCAFDIKEKKLGQFSICCGSM